MEINDIVKSMMMFSVGYAVFTPEGKILLLKRAHPPESIPEDGTLALVAGFNRWPGNPVTISGVALLHLQDKLGLALTLITPQEDFLGSPYPSSVQAKPVRIPLGGGAVHEFYGPRQALTAKLVLTQEQIGQIRLNPKFYSGYVTLTRDELEDAFGKGEVSFPYQMKVVRSFFD